MPTLRRGGLTQPSVTLQGEVPAVYKCLSASGIEVTPKARAKVQCVSGRATPEAIWKAVLRSDIVVLRAVSEVDGPAAGSPSSKLVLALAIVGLGRPIIAAARYNQVACPP